MKKVISLILSLVMVLSLCACGAKEEAPAAAPAGDAPAADAAVETKVFKCAFNQTATNPEALTLEWIGDKL